MKYWRTAWIGLLALLAIGFAVLWFLPASWAMPLLAPRLNGVRLQQVSGLIWDGQAGQVLSAKGENLGQASWQLSRRALLGDNQLHVQVNGPRVDFDGRMQSRNANEAHWTDVHLRADLGLLGPRMTLPIGQPRGEVEITAGNALLRGGWPVSMDAQVQWRNATLLTPSNGELPLGALQLALQADNGAITGNMRDGGSGPLRIDGQVQFSPLARRFTAEVTPRQPNAALQRWLSTLGATDANGVTHINYSGGLAAAMSRGKS